MISIPGTIGYFHGKYSPAGADAGNPEQPECIIYEVIRIIHGVPLFLEDHLDRLHQSLLKKLSVSFSFDMAPETIIKELIRKNEFREGNIRLEVLLCDNGRQINAFYIPHYYPSEEEYLSGVVVTLSNIERSHPNIKVHNENYRNAIRNALNGSPAFETLLVNKQGEITEGSRSNVFFISEDILFTPPSHQVLEGVTRKKVVQLAAENGITMRESSIHVDDLGGYQSVFLTGTSPKILPVQSIGTFHYNAGHPVIKKLAAKYDQLIWQYVRERLPEKSS